MKQIKLFLVAAILPLLGFSQSIFDKYEEMDNVGSVVVNKNMLNLLTSIGEMDSNPETQEFVNTAKNIDGIKVFITEDKSRAADMNTTVKKYLKSSKLEELMRIKEKDMNVIFYVKNGKNDNHVSELLMFVSGMKNKEIEIIDRKFETVLVSMTGDIDLNKIGQLTKKMNLPSHLNKVGDN